MEIIAKDLLKIGSSKEKENGEGTPNHVFGTIVRKSCNKWRRWRASNE